MGKVMKTTVVNEQNVAVTGMLLMQKAKRWVESLQMLPSSWKAQAYFFSMLMVGTCCCY